MDAKREEKRKNRAQLILTAGVGAGIFFLLFVLRGLWPLGEGSILMIDLHTQYMPLLYRFYDVVTGAKNLFVDLSVSGGMNLYADTVNELINPFNYLLLPFGRDRLSLAVNLLPVFYGTAAAVTSCAALQRLWPGKRRYNVILSLSYAFSGYMAYQFQIIRWLYLPVLFPLYLLAMVRTLRKGRWGAYALLLGYQLALSLQMGAMALLFALFGSGAWFWLQKGEGSKARRSCVGLGLGTLTGVLLSSPVLLPQILLLLHSARAGENLSYFSVMKRHGLDDLFERAFQVFQPVLAGLVIYWGGKGIKRLRRSKEKLPREGKALLGWNLFLCLTVAAQPSNLLWHLGSYMCFPVRYAYMVLFSCVLLGKWLAVWTEEKEEDGIRVRPFPAVGALCLSAAAVAGSLFYQDRITQAFSSLAISMTCPGEAARAAFLLLLIAAGSLLALGAGRARRILLTCMAGASGLCFFLFLMLPRDSQVRQFNEAAYARLNREYVQNRGSEKTAGFARAQDDPDLPLNAALVRGGSSLSGYFPSGCEKVYAEGMERLGYLTPWVSVRSWGGTRISDGLLGIAGADPVFPGGVFFPDNPEEIRFLYEEACTGGPLAVQDALGRLLAGEEILERISWGTLPGDGEGGRILELSEECALYLDAAREAGFLSVRVNGAEMEFPEGMLRESPHRLLYLGTYPAGSVRILAEERGGGPFSGEGMKLGLLFVNRWEKAAGKVLEKKGRAEALEAGQVYLKEREGEIVVRPGEGRGAGTLFLPVAACDGWQVYADGKDRRPERLWGGFLGVRLSGEEEELVFRFVPPGWKAGLLLGLLGLIGLGFHGLFGIRGSFAQRREKTEELVFTVYRVILAAGLIGIYGIPNVGLLCYLCGRAIGIFFK